MTIYLLSFVLHTSAGQKGKEIMTGALISRHYQYPCDGLKPKAYVDYCFHTVLPRPKQDVQIGIEPGIKRWEEAPPKPTLIPVAKSWKCECLPVDPPPFDPNKAPVNAPGAKHHG
jgi:hypothetical protein